MIEAYKSYWKNSSNFKDRTTRSGYWYAILVHMIVAFVLGFIFVFLSTKSEVVALFFSLILGLFCLASILPTVAISIRRIHDINKSGWWFLIGFVPFGGFILLAFFCTASVTENNNYGETV